MKSDFNISEWEKYLPRPIYDERPELEPFYKKAWELARAHIRSIDGMPQNPYMDEAFCDTQIWIWDTCFMSLFCKYAQTVFPGKESLNNFYEVLHGDRSLPMITPSENEPEWTGATPGVPSRIKICIGDNPPLFAFAEYENALFHGDKEYIKELLYSRGWLQKHYEWIESLTEQIRPKGVRSMTWLRREECGYRWEGGRSGMDNTPRGRVGEHAENDRPNNPDMLWIDAICQQALSAKLISEMLETVGDGDGAAEWRSRYLEKKEIVNRLYWDEEDGFYYDIDRNTHDFYKVMSIASYWTLISGIATSDRAERMMKYIRDEKYFGGRVPLISLSRGDSDYVSDGRYWRGALWLPTAYATLKGLRAYGYRKEAREAAVNILSHMLETYNEYTPHTIWECYSPEERRPSRNPTDTEDARPDFCGWSALGPISIYIEYVLGFHTVNAFENTVEWARDEGAKGRVGIENLRFGNVVTDIVSEGNICRVTSNEPYTLKINGKSYSVASGDNTIEI